MLVAAVADTRAPPATQSRHIRRALSAARGHLQKTALKLLGWVVLAFLLLKLVPSLKQALHSLEHVSWVWIVGALALEVLSENGYVISWRWICDPDGLLGRDGRAPRTSTHAAWAQLGGGMVVPGGSLASIGVGAWILRRFGMPSETIAERQFNLSFLNTAVIAITLVLFGVGLALGLLSGESNLLLTLVPAVIAAGGIVGAVLISRAATTYSGRLEGAHPKIAGFITSLAEAVAATRRILFHHERAGSLVGALGYMWFDAMVLWTAFLAIGAHSIPSVGVVLMAYIIGALAGSIPLPAGIGAVGGIAGMLVLYGVAHNAAIAAVLLYEAIGLVVPLIGGGFAYLMLRRRFGPMQTLDGT